MAISHGATIVVIGVCVIEQVSDLLRRWDPLARAEREGPPNARHDRVINTSCAFGRLAAILRWSATWGSVWMHLWISSGSRSGLRVAIPLGEAPPEARYCDLYDKMQI